ncbi:hypothetical protein ACS0TY_025745 [Phlomoides rotata]
MDHRTRGMVDASAGGSLLGRTTDEGYLLLEEMAKNGNQWPSERRQHRRVAATQDYDAIASLSTKFDNLMSMMTKQVGEPQFEEAQYMGYQRERSYGDRNWQERQPRGNPPPNSNQYHPGLRHHENFSYANPRNALQPPENFKVHKGVIEESSSPKPSMEEMFTTFMGETTKFMKETRQEISMVKDHVKVIERQVSQLATIVGSQHKQGQLPLNTELNPNAQCHAIMVRSGTSYDEPKMPVEEGVEHDEKEEVKKKDDEEVITPTSTIDKGKQDAHIPYPKRLKKKNLDTNKVSYASFGVSKMSRPYDMIEEPDGLSCGCFNIFKKGSSKKFQNKERDGVT